MRWGFFFLNRLRESDPVCMHGEIMYTVLTCISGSCSSVLLRSDSGYNRKTSVQNVCREQNLWICCQSVLYLLSIYIWEEYFKKTSATLKINHCLEATYLWAIFKTAYFLLQASRSSRAERTQSPSLQPWNILVNTFKTGNSTPTLTVEYCL